MRSIGIAWALFALATPAAAGELVLENGSRLDADLAPEVLVVSTGSALVEVTPETVGLLTPSEVHLRDGRVVLGTLVGGHFRARTALGELTVKVDDLRAFRGNGFPAAAEPEAPAPVAGAPEPATAAASAATSAPAPQAGLPSVALFQPPAAPPPPARAVATRTEPASATVAVTAPRRPIRLVIVETQLYRDAVAAGAVGRVSRGERVIYLDSIDRRLRIFNSVVFDGGYWIKVRASNGTEGWVPAATLREAE
jgi:hypothetical protein